MIPPPRLHRIHPNDNELKIHLLLSPYTQRPPNQRFDQRAQKLMKLIVTYYLLQTKNKTFINVIYVLMLPFYSLSSLCLHIPNITNTYNETTHHSFLFIITSPIFSYNSIFHFLIVICFGNISIYTQKRKSFYFCCCCYCSLGLFMFV
jgi:hypothetical protein